MAADSFNPSSATGGARSPSWEILHGHKLFSAPPWLTVYQERIRLPSGKIIDDFYRVVLPEFAMVVPRTTSGKFIMVRGYKHGPRRAVLSPPAGLIEQGETALEAAQRELREETGYGGGEWTAISRLVADGNRECGTMHLFSATGVQQLSTPLNDEMEPISVVEMHREELVQALADGQVGTMAAAAGLGTVLAACAE